MLRLHNIKRFCILATLLVAWGTVWGESLLEGKKWTTATNVSGHSGTMQGAAYYNGKIYQFTDKCAKYGVYDIATNTWSAGEALNTGVLADCHFGSACFGPESTKTYSVNGVEHTSTFPLLFVTGHDKTSNPKAIVIYVIDFELKQCVTQLRFEHTDNRDDKIAAYDFDNNKIYIFGYPVSVMEGHTPYTVWTYSGVNFNTFASESVTMSPNLTGETNAHTGIGGPNAAGIQENLACGTLQDCHYHNGYIYYATSRGSEYNRTEFAKVHALNVSTWQVEKTMVCNNATEPEGFAFDSANEAFYMTCGGNKLWKLSTGSGYDANNYQPATLISGGTYDGYYEIKTASQFVWFKSMVYNGCTTMKAYLANDINMSGQTDPFTYYIYNSDIQSGTTTPKFEAQFAFRGTFDGNGHTIKNVNITSTPYYNDGVFPYVMGATIKNLTAEGSIKLSQCRQLAYDEAQDKNVIKTDQPVANVGLIGYMDGGTLENVDVKGLTIDETVAGVSGTINKLIGSENGTITKTNCVTEDPSSTTHTTAGGHVYINGFCALQDATANDYQPATQDAEGYYEIDNGGKLFWFANLINTNNGANAGVANLKAKLTADIDLESRAFPGIALYKQKTNGTKEVYYLYDGGTSWINKTKNGNTVQNGKYVGSDGTTYTYGGHSTELGKKPTATTVDPAGDLVVGYVYGVEEYVYVQDESYIYSGTFDGQGHTISNFSRTSSNNCNGLFAYLKNATVRNFKINGEIICNGGQQHGSVFGQIGTDCTIEDIHSSVTVKGVTGVNQMGGFAGRIMGTVNRCRYSGTISGTDGNNPYNKFGGFVGSLVGGTISNCLFDGKMITASTSTSLYAGGFAGGSFDAAGGKMLNCLMVGTITSTGTTTGVGVLVGNIANNDYTATNVYYSLANVQNGVTSMYGVKGTSKTVTIDATNCSGMTWPAVKDALNDGSTNWGINSQQYPVPGETDGTPATTYTITFNTNGGDPCASQSRAENSTITLPTPTKSGYTFNGWDTVEGGTGTRYQGGASYTITGDATLYAQWTASTTEYDANGFNKQFNTCDEADKYEAATKDTDGYYIIDNAGKLFWFANQVNAGNASYNAKVTKDINMDGTNHTDFPGIGYYVSTAGGDRKPFSGNFDGQGHRIYNCNITTNNSSYWGSGLIGYAYATGSPKKEIKNFTLEGKVTAKCAARAGGVLGYVADGYNISGITSSVDIESTTLKTGGLAGFVSTSTVSKCRFNGTITNSNNWTGGLIAEVLRSCEISDCLFDGTVNATRDNADVATGGIAAIIGGASANTVSNCLSYGTITTKKTGTNTGKVFGRVDGELALSNVYYGAQGTSTPTIDYNENGKTITGSVTTITSETWQEIKTALNNGSVPTVWGIGSQVYPVPGEADQTQYTITFNTNGGSTCASVTRSANTVITLPETTKVGFVFTGWDTKEDGTGTRYAAGANYTIINDVTLYAQWAVAYTIIFNTNGGSACDAVTKTAGTVINLPTPIRADYIFNSWNTKEDGTGTSYAGGASYTITANATLYAQWTEDESGDYRNGFHKTHDTSAADYYQAPVEVTNENYESLGLTSAYVGYYEVKNAGNMYWISKNFSSIENTRKYVMTADINMDGENHNDWPGIATTYKADCSTHFQGVFDGLGHKFTNYYLKATSGNYKSMFGVVTNATIKNFSIDGQVEISVTNGIQYGAVVGRVNGGLNNTIEDIHSSVNITADNTKTISAIGGIVGQCSGPTNFNRCRYSGTITGNSSYNGLGGILGNAESTITFDNCLFDGTIKTDATPDRTTADNGLKLGGICSRNNSTNKTTITNSMSHGTISVKDAADKGNVGVIMGTQTSTGKLTITNTYYTAITGINAVGNNSNTDKSAAAPTEKTTQTWEEIKTSLNGSSNPVNWGINSQVYPVPGETDGVTLYTITFNTDGGTEIDPISQKAGTAVTAPADPTKTGHTFAGWVDENGTATTVPATMPAKNITLKATWTVIQYTIKFDLNGGTSAAIADITQDYGTAITAPADPTKDGWDFGGWDPAIPSTMPAENITCVACWYQDTYTNGFNDNWSTCAENKKYEAPKLITADRCSELGIDASYATDGYYEVKNAGNMFWISKYFSTIENNRKFVMTSNIDMEGNNANHKDWEGIATTYNADGSTHFKGVFDGLGHKFTNYYLNITYNNNKFNYKSLFGIIEGATIKNFSIDGQVDIRWVGSQYGSAVGRANNGTNTIEDVHSSVNFTVYDDKAASSIGGIVGQGRGTTNVNRCRYNGTITGNSAHAGLGGIVGNGEGIINISNCLFDGTITTTAKETRTGADNGIKIGGLFGRNTSTTKITNSMSIGTITVTPGEGTFDGANSNVGIVMGTQTAQSLTITNTFYSTSNCTTGIGTVGNNSSSNPSLAAPTELPTSPDWATIRKTLGMSNWVIDQEKYGKEYPIPAVFICTHSYDQYGFCTICEAPEPIGDPDADGYYLIDHLADLAQFAAKVNNSASGTIINAKVTADIDLTDYGKTLTTTIGDESHHYCGTFDGQGHTMKGITVESNQRYVGLFACVGIKATDESNVKNGIVKNFSVSGTITSSYFSQWYTNTPLVMGVIGEVYSGTIENVHSSVNFSCTSGTRSHIGGVVGGSLHNDSDAGNIVIKNCTYEGTMTLNACDAIGGIVGYAQHKTNITNTMFSGTINQNYTRPDGEDDEAHDKNEGSVSTYIGGALGYCNSSSDGVQNCVLAGTMTTDQTIVSDGTMKKGANNLNAVVGYDGQINNSYNNYLGNYVTETYNTNYHQYPSDKFSGTSKVRSDAQFVTGEICAELNADASATDNPWGQILGYQVGANKDPNSPAQAYPYPGYTDPSKTTYRVVREVNATDDTKYDYTADYYFFDDYGDTTPYPTDAASMKVKKIKYTRVKENEASNSYMGIVGYNSMCLPFEFTTEMAPAGAEFYTYDRYSAESVIFREKTLPIEAGTPFIMKLDGSADWSQTIVVEAGTPVALSVKDPNSTNGLYGVFNTVSLGTGYWKLNGDGSKLVKTKAESHCYPYRAYLKLPIVSHANSREYRPVFGTGNMELEEMDIELMGADGQIYYINGQKAPANAKGLVIENGKVVFKK